METRYPETPVADSPVTSTRREGRDTRIAAVMLIAFGLLFFVGRWVDLGVAILPLLALGFVGWGIVTRAPGLFVPGGILGGIGLGAMLTEGPMRGMVSADEGGLFMLAFAAGWASIVVLTALFTDETQWWALIPGGIMAFIGAAILIGDGALVMLNILGMAWPLALIALGLYLLLRRRSPLS